MRGKPRSRSLTLTSQQQEPKLTQPEHDVGLCHHCEVRCEERTSTEPITWGTDGWTKYGRHVFEGIEQRYWHCPKCDHEFIDYTQWPDNERRLNEAIKAKLGIDWLAENAARRAQRKAEGRDTRGRRND